MTKRRSDKSRTQRMLQRIPVPLVRDKTAIDKNNTPKRKLKAKVGGKIKVKAKSAMSPKARIIVP